MAGSASLNFELLYELGEGFGVTGEPIWCVLKGDLLLLGVLGRGDIDVGFALLSIDPLQELGEFLTGILALVGGALRDD